MKNIWQELKKPAFGEARPILVQAPMEGVTDTVFRQIIASCGKPDIFFTEFTSVDAICHSDSRPAGQRLQYTKIEKPIIAQIWGNTPKNYYQAVKTIIKLGFDGVDINMGCPIRDVIKKGFCAGLINNPALAREIIASTKEAAKGFIPVSVKTRIGYDRIITKEWIGFLLSQGLNAIIIHGRTAKELSKVPTHWEEIAKAVNLRNQMKIKTVIIGNGDVKNQKEAFEKWKTYRVDGVMIGRGILENPWVFNKNIDPSSIPPQKMNLLIKHINLFAETYGNQRSFALMKKFYKTYVNGFKKASQLRDELMATKTKEETIKIIKIYQKSN